jgi:hypothetical protein
MSHGCPYKAPLSGSEPNPDPAVWNDDPNVRHTHNCYAFMAQALDPKKVEQCKADPECNVPFNVPGNTQGLGRVDKKYGIMCGNVVARVRADIPDAEPTIFSKRCPKGFSKVAVVTDPKGDYHFYLQGPNGLWIHKPGGRAFTDKDAAGSLIVNPELAARYYAPEYPGDTTLDYNSFCTFMCVPRDKPIILAGGAGTGGAGTGGATTRRAKTRRLRNGRRNSRRRRKHLKTRANGRLRR